MTMRYPATRWQDGLPTGSGVVGVLVYGNIQEDTILLNHSGLYYPMASPEMVDTSDILPTVRDLIKKGQSREAAQLTRDTYSERITQRANPPTAPYQPFCSIRLKTNTNGPFRNYRRSVNFENGCVRTEWKDDVASFSREVFVSRTTDYVYVRLRADKPGSVNISMALAKAKDEQTGKRLVHTGRKPEEMQLEELCSVFPADCRLSWSASYANGFVFGGEAVEKGERPGYWRIHLQPDAPVRISSNRECG